MTGAAVRRDLLVRGVLALDPDDGWAARHVDIEIDGGRIAAVVPAHTSLCVAARTIDGTDRLLAPGFVNAHTHSPANVLKGTGDRLDHRAFMWTNQADTIGRAPDEIRLAALVGAIEHLRGGTTTVVDHFPEQGFGETDVDALADAYAQAGLRAGIALRIFDAPYDDILPAGGFPADAGVANPLAPPDVAHQLGLVDALVQRHDGAADGRIRVMPAPSNPLRCSDALLVGAHALARRHGTGVHTHLLETRVQSTLARERHGVSMVAHLDRLGVLDERLSCAHVIWVDDADIALLAERGTLVVHNPESNLKIGAGFAPIVRMLHAGVHVAVGTDGANTNDNLGMHEALRLAAILPRPTEPEIARWPSVPQVLSMGTRAGGRALPLADLGRIAPGAPADLVLHDLAAPAWIPLNDPAAQLLFAESGGSVRTVIVAGRVVVDDGRITTFDADAVLREARGIVARLRERNAPLHRAVQRIAAGFSHLH